MIYLSFSLTAFQPRGILYNLLIFPITSLLCISHYDDLYCFEWYLVLKVLQLFYPHEFQPSWGAEQDCYFV